MQIPLEPFIILRYNDSARYLRQRSLKGIYMNTEKKPSSLRFSPKIILVILIATAIVVLSALFLFRSIWDGGVLESIDAGDFRFDLCGDGSLSKIKIYKDGKKTATLKTSSVGNAENHYGVTVIDLSFDGSPDLLVAVKNDGADTCYNAWLWNPSTGTLRSQEAFINVKNPTLNEEYGAIVSKRHEQRDAGEDANGVYYEEAEVISVYTAVDGALVEFIRYEFVYYTKNDIYAVLVYRFDEDTGEISSFSEDSWLSPDEAKDFVLSVYADADMEKHKSNYPNAAE